MGVLLRDSIANPEDGFKSNLRGGFNRAWAVPRKFMEDYPQRFNRLVETFEEAMNDPAVLDAFTSAGMIADTISYTDMEGAMKIAEDTLEMANKYADVLAGG